MVTPRKKTNSSRHIYQGNRKRRYKACGDTKTEQKIGETSSAGQSKLRAHTLWSHTKTGDGQARHAQQGHRDRRGMLCGQTKKEDGLSRHLQQGYCNRGGEPCGHRKKGSRSAQHVQSMCKTCSEGKSRPREHAVWSHTKKGDGLARHPQKGNRGFERTSRGRTQKGDRLSGLP